MGAYDSARVARVFDDILQHDPDLVVVLTGNNGGGPSIGCTSLARQSTSAPPVALAPAAGLPA